MRARNFHFENKTSRAIRASRRGPGYQRRIARGDEWLGSQQGWENAKKIAESPDLGRKEVENVLELQEKGAAGWLAGCTPPSTHNEH